VTSDPEQAAALLQSPPGWADWNDLDEKLQQLPGVGGAAAELYLGWAWELDENGRFLTPAFGEALREASAAIAAAAGQLESVIGGGILRKSRAASFPEARAQLPRIPARHQHVDPRQLVLGRWLADRDPHAGAGRSRRTG